MLIFAFVKVKTIRVDVLQMVRTRFGRSLRRFCHPDRI